jgi:hypothetical protein
MTDAELRELDSRVHREVMGVAWDESRCRVCGWPVVPEGGSGCWASNCSLRPSPIIRADAVPEYSSDIAQAWKVVERFRPYVKVDARGVGGEPWVCSIWVGGPEIEGRGDTAPLAICRAALAVWDRIERKST